MKALTLWHLYVKGLEKLELHITEIMNSNDNLILQHENEGSFSRCQYSVTYLHHMAPQHCCNGASQSRNVSQAGQNPFDSLFD